MNELLLKVWRWILERANGVVGEHRGNTGPEAGGAAPAPLPTTVLALPLRACASVVIPALNEAARIADVVRYALADPATAEVIVVDDSSIDDTAMLARQAGAHVVTSTMLGKGASMRDGLHEAQCELIVYLDGDLAGLRPGIVTDLCRPLLRGEADFVKARFGRGGGRVTELTAKPMLKVFFPELAHFAQPLGGIIAARRSLLQPLEFEDGYGVDVGLLLDAHRSGARLAEVDIGSLEHDSQPLLDLTVMANEVSRVIYARAREAGRLHVEQIAAMYETQRQATASIEYIVTRRRSQQRLLLLDMDGTITSERFVVELARATGREAALSDLLDDAAGDAVTRSERIAEVFRFIHRRQFQQVAADLKLRSGVIAFVNRMKRNGFMVGVVSDSYFVAAEVLRRRVFADFALAHMLQFEGEVCSGRLKINPAFQQLDSALGPAICKGNVLARFLEDDHEPRITQTWAVGDNVDDIGLLRRVDRAFAIDPKSPEVLRVPGIVRVDSIADLMALAGDLSADPVEA